MHSYDLDLLDQLDLLEADYATPPASPKPSPNLFKVPDPRAAPWRWVCKILVRYERTGLKTPVTGAPITGLWYGGSGTLISRCHVLTAGHIIRAMQGTSRLKPVQVLVVPAQVPGATLATSAPFGVWSARPSNTFVPDSLFSPTQATARLFDYGLIQLDRKNFKHLGQMTVKGVGPYGWFGSNPGDSLKQFNDIYGATIGTRKVNLAGFPKVGGTDQQMYRGYNSIDAVRPSLRPGGPRVPLLRYRIPTSGGVSGGPVWLYSSKTRQRRLVAVHNGNQSGMGWGVLLGSTLIRFLTANGASAAGLRVS